MLRREKFLTGLALLAICVLALWGAYNDLFHLKFVSPQSPVNRARIGDTPQQITNQNQTPTQLLTHPNTAATPRRERNGIIDENEWNPDWWLVLGTMALAIAGFWQAAITRDTSRRQLRAYVYFDGPKIREWPPVDPNRLSIIVDVTNNGETWARKFTSQTGIVRMDPADTSDPFTLVNWEENKPAPISLGPRQTLHLQVGDLTFDEGRAIRDGKLIIFAVGLLRYEDAVTVPAIARRTEMCRRLNVDAEGGHAFSNAVSHNCADEDCPN